MRKYSILLKFALYTISIFCFLFSSTVSAFALNNLALNKTTWAGSQHATLGPSYAVDGIKDSSSYWHGFIVYNVGSDYLKVDLGSAVRITGFELTNYSSTIYSEDFKIQGSIDNSSYTDLYIVQSNTAYQVSGNFSSPGDYRYVKVLITRSNSDGFARISELEIYGSYSVTSKSVGSIGSTTASVSGELINTNGLSVSSKGFVYSKSSDPTVSDTVVNADNTSIGSYSSTLLGLTPNTTYHVRAFSNVGGTYYYGDDAIFTTTQVPQSITFSAIAAKIYGDEPIPLNAEVSSGLTPIFTSSNTSVASISGSSLVIVGPGTATISAIQDGNTTYAAATVNRSLTVSPKALRVTGTFSANGRPYDGTTAASFLVNNLTLSGIVSGDAVTFIPNLAFSNKDEGTKTVSLTNTSTLSGTDSGKYQLDLTSAPTTSAAISKKELTVSGISVTSKVYDGTTAAAISGGTLVGVVGSEDVSLTYAALGSFDSKNVGTSKSVTTFMEITGTAISNYTLTQPTLTGTITAKPLTVSGAAVIKKVYDGTTLAAITGAALKGKLAGDDVTLMDAASGAFASKNVNAGISVTPLFSLSGGDAGNYTLQLPSLTGEISQKPLVITADSKTKTSDGTTFSAFTASYNRFAAGESVSDLSGTLQIGGDAVTATAAGVYTITAGGLSSTNYDITYVDGTLTIAAVSSRSSSSSNANTPATTSTTTVNGQQASVMTLNPQAVTQALNQSRGPEITLRFTNPQPVNVATLDGQILQTLSSQNASLVMETQHASYTVPAAQIDLAGAAQQLGPGVPAAAVKVEITIADPTATQAKIVEDSSAKGGFQVVVSPMDFSITCSYGDKSVEVSGFDSYVSRMVAIPQNVDVGKVSTAVVVRQDGTWYHVPTRIVVMDGKYFAQINSLSNSTYVTIWHPVAFRDMERHWAKETVNDLGSRFVVSGDGDGLFAPERSITRAEFAAILMKGLGISSVSDAGSFKDVKVNDWYFGYVSTAYEYNLISGYGDRTFRPNERITREQAMVMIARAMEITGLEVSMNDGETGSILSRYRDASSASRYARNGIATCIKAGVVSGRNDGKLGAKASITRAEVAIIIRNLLIKSDLI